jgi:hypothetical protein
VSTCSNQFKDHKPEKYQKKTMKEISNRMKMGIGSLLLGCLMLTGCASGPRFTAAPAPAPDKALVYVYRKSSFVGSAGYDKLYINGHFVARIYTGGYVPYEVSPGTVSFALNPKAEIIPGDVLVAALSNLDQTKYEKLRIEAEAGKTYYVNLYTQFIGHGMKLVDEAIGAKEIGSLKLSETEKAE